MRNANRELVWYVRVRMGPKPCRKASGNTTSFGAAPPRWTAVVFLDFPRTGQGGELVVFPRGAFDDGDPVPRENAHATITAAGGCPITPQPGRICHLAGDLPHAVLCYSADEGDCRRLALVLAEFGN